MVGPPCYFENKDQNDPNSIYQWFLDSKHSRCDVPRTTETPPVRTANNSKQDEKGANFCWPSNGFALQ